MSTTLSARFPLSSGGNEGRRVRNAERSPFFNIFEKKIEKKIENFFSR